MTWRQTLDKIVDAAVAEYNLEHALESADERLGRAAAVRGMMVRLGLYAEFNDALDKALFPSPTAGDEELNN